MDSKQKRTVSLLALCALLQAGCSGQGTIPAAQAQLPAAGPAAAAAVADAIVASAAPLAGLHLRDAGPAEARTTLALALTLRYRNADRLDRLVAEQSDPHSAYYRRWLSNEQFAATFAPAEADYRKVEASLQRAGFHVDATYANRTVVDASAPVETIERYFETSIHRVRPAEGGVAYANVRPAFAPRELNGLLLAVDGLTTVAIAHPYHDTVKRGDASHAPKAANASLFGPISTATNARGYAPLAFSAGYDLPVEHANGTKHYDGSGRTSGIVIDADFAESDLRTYLAYFSIKRNGPATKRNLLKGGPPQGDAGADAVEAALDAEAIVGNAPGTALWMYEIPKLSGADITDAYNTIVSDNKVDTANFKLRRLRGSGRQDRASLERDRRAGSCEGHHVPRCDGGLGCEPVRERSRIVAVYGCRRRHRTNGWNRRSVGARSRMVRQRRRHLDHIRPALLADGRSRDR